MSRHLKISHNKSGRDFVVGDLHGCYDLLMRKMSDVDFDTSRDRLFSVGDLIDRGSKSFECLKLIDQHWFFACVGNHEELFAESFLNPLEHVRLANYDCWMGNGGEWSKKHSEQELLPYVKYIRESMPYAITIGHGEKYPVGICHAQPPSRDWSDVEKESMWPTMTWARTKVKKEDLWSVRDMYMTYHGHSIVYAPRKLGNTVFIDTGAHYSGDLTMLEIKVPEDD